MKDWKNSLFAMLFASSHSLACDPDSVALRYLSAIDAINWEEMRSFLAKDAIYTDATTVHYGRDEFNLHGTANVVEFWKNSFNGSGTRDIGYTVTSCLKTAGNHVVGLSIAVAVSGEFWNVAKDVIDISGRVVSVIRVEDDLVTQQQVFLEYEAADRVVADLRKRYGEFEASRGL
ncbi:MAG: nuclear transport factor 2 family protein [Pseudomonadota bacterium]